MKEEEVKTAMKGEEVRRLLGMNRIKQAELATMVDALRVEVEELRKREKERQDIRKSQAAAASYKAMGLGGRYDGPGIGKYDYEGEKKLKALYARAKKAKAKEDEKKVKEDAKKAEKAAAKKAPKKKEEAPAPVEKKEEPAPAPVEKKKPGRPKKVLSPEEIAAKKEKERLRVAAYREKKKAEKNK